MVLHQRHLWWTGPLLVLTALAAVARYFEVSVGNLHGAGWVLIGVTLLLTPAPAVETDWRSAFGC